MSASTIYDLLSSLEQTIHERFRIINHLLASQLKAPETGLATDLLARVAALEARLEATRPEVTLEKRPEAPFRQEELLPMEPMVGLTVSPRQIIPDEKVITVAPVLPTVAPVLPTVVTAEAEVALDIDCTSVIDAPEEVADEAEEAEEAEEEAVELEEFEYKGATYYRDSDNNVFTTDEDGELNNEPFGIWNEAKQRIVARS